MNTSEPIKPEEFRAMAAAINRVHVAAKAMAGAGLSQEAIVILLHHKTRVPQRDIKAVMFGLSNFGSDFLTKEYRQKLLEEAK